MGSKATSLVAQDYRMKEWIEMVRECKARPKGMKVTEWCKMYGITKDVYCYRLTKIREACLEEATKQKDATAASNVIVSVSENLIQQTIPKKSSGIDISVNNAIVHVSDDTSPQLLKMVLEVITHA